MHTFKVTRHVDKQENITYNQEKNQSIKSDLEMTETMKLADKDFITATINMVKDLKENISVIKLK